MHHNVRRAAGRLVGGQGVGQLGVHHRELAPAQVAVVPPLDAALLLGDNAGIAHLAACRGDGQHRAQGGAGLGGVLPVVQVPHVKVVGQAVANGLGGVDHAAAAHRQQEVHALLLAQFNALVHQREPGIGLHPAQRHVGDARRVQRGVHPVQQAAFLGALPAKVNQHFRGALLLAQLANLVFHTFAKDHLGGGLEHKIVHICPSFLHFLRRRPKQRP